MKPFTSPRTLLAAALLSAASAVFAQDPHRMRVHFIDVGQGSATLLEYRCGAVLIDAGAAKSKASALDAYLERFFRLRPDLNRTLSSVHLTHCHADHAMSLESLARKYRIRHLVDDGVRKGSGKSFLDRATSLLARATPLVFPRGVSDVEARSAAPDGLTDAAIDPVRCDECDPELRVLAGGHDAPPPGWGSSAFDNLNNHSLVVRASLGAASILVTGDLETEGIRRLTDFYGGGARLAAGILVAGHHGARNGVTPDLVRLVAPQLSVISCGRWDDGKGERDRFTTWCYGHANKGVVETLASGTAGARTPIDVKVGTGAQRFEDLRVDRAVYCTGWDGSFVVDAFDDGRLVVRSGGLLSLGLLGCRTSCLSNNLRDN